MNSGRWSPFSTVYWVPQPFSTPEYVDSDRILCIFVFLCVYHSTATRLSQNCSHFFESSCLEKDPDQTCGRVATQQVGGKISLPACWGASWIQKHRWQSSSAWPTSVICRSQFPLFWLAANVPWLQRSITFRPTRLVESTLPIGVTNFRHTHHVRLKDAAHHGAVILYKLRNQDFRAMGLEGAATQVRCLGLQDYINKISLFVYYTYYLS